MPESSQTDGALLATVIDRLDADAKAKPFEAYVLAAFDGADALAKLLESDTPPARPQGIVGTTHQPRGAYLKSITVEGFRGIGARQTLELPPGPGLTLVVGRNGSGKSSFAEALELLLTGDIHRWQEAKSKVWREGWRNLHHTAARVDAEFHVEGEKGATTVTTVWKDGADLAERDTFAQVHGKPLAVRVRSCGAALSDVCHQHAYELAPTLGELSVLLDVVHAFVGRTEANIG